MPRDLGMSYGVSNASRISSFKKLVYCGSMTWVSQDSGGCGPESWHPIKSRRAAIVSRCNFPLATFTLILGCGLGQKEQFNFSLELQHYLKQYLEKADVIAWLIVIPRALPPVNYFPHTGLVVQRELQRIKHVCKFLATLAVERWNPTALPLNLCLSVWFIY